jgi:hypothetical protein
MTTNVFLEAFGQFAGTLPEEDRLYPAFDSRAEMMGWTHTQSPTPPYAWLWDMHDAEITAERNTHRLGWVQVGLHGESKMPGSENWPTIIPADHPSSFSSLWDTSVDTPPNLRWPYPRWASVLRTHSAAVWNSRGQDCRCPSVIWNPTFEPSRCCQGHTSGLSKPLPRPAP